MPIAVHKSSTVITICGLISMYILEKEIQGCFMPDYLQYYGSDEQPSKPLKLTAGPISLLFQDGMIRSISFGEHEIVRRVYMALRDRVWNTIHPEITPLRSSIGESSFHVSFEAVHKKNEIHYKWLGDIRGEADGTIRFSMQGEALSTFQRNRIGFCVLHPLELCVGRACRIEKTDGSISEETFPVFISPWQPFTNLRAISYKVPPNARAFVRFEGDTFEMEDQRNWTDASFKTYSTPLSLPMPVTFDEGTQIEQVITISIETPEIPEVLLPRPLEIRIPPQGRYSRLLPKIGVTLAKDDPLTPFTVEMLHALSLDHLRIDIRCDSENLVGDMEHAARLCSLLALPAELALHCTSNYQSEFQLLKQVLKASQILVHRFLVYRTDLPVTPADTIKAAILGLGSYAPSAELGAGTDSYFVEINRQHPSTDFLDLICYSANPQVHTFDNASVMENLQGLAETLRTASLFQGKAHPAISPITLRPRVNPEKPEKFGGADPRQRGLFGAVWTLGSLMHCINGGAASLTYYETSGPAGLMPSQKHVVYPAYHVFASVLEMAGALVQSCECNDHDKIACLVLTRGTRILVLIGNLTDIPQQVTIFELPETISILSLDETTCEEATRFPQNWRCKKGEQRSANAPFHVFDILPYGILRIEASLVK